jgi:CheY-like chemotaxis protein
MTRTRILVVEDEALVAEEIKRRLNKLGYDVPDTAASGKEAILKAEEFKPDMVLMDIRLKGDMDGLKAAKKIQDHSHLPVIYLTAYADEGTLRRAKITEPYGYILKPFKERELHIAIEMALYKHKAEAERKKLIRELQQALAEIKTLKGIVPICASCKKIRDDKGYWQQLEAYIREHSQAEFSHGICPDCARKLYSTDPSDKS